VDDLDMMDEHCNGTEAGLFALSLRTISRCAWKSLSLLIREEGVKCCGMTLTMNIPDELSGDLNAGFHDLGRTVLEALAAEAYEKDVLSLDQVRTLLRLDSRWEAQDVLCNYGVWPGLTADEIVGDADSSARFRASLP